MKQTGLLFTPDNYDKSAQGIKTMTRRIIAADIPADADEVFYYRQREERSAKIAPSGVWARKHGDDGYIRFIAKCPYGTVGDRLYVKEGFCVGRPALPSGRGIIPHYGPLSAIHDPIIKYKRDWGESDPPKWRSPLFMPKWAARLWLELIEVRAERLQDISEQDAIAEGVELLEGTMNPDDFTGCWTNYDPLAPEPYWNSPIDSYHSLWASIYGPDSWQLNPWLLVLSYRKLTVPVPQP